MSIPLTPHRVGSEAFALLVRLFAGLKRKGRVIDVVWFQQDAHYARTVLALADDSEEDGVREIAGKLRALLADFLAVPRETPLPVTPVREVRPEVVTDVVHPDDRYVGRLR